jgi:hypothetical protein
MIQGIVYKIRSLNPEITDKYIGSTTRWMNRKYCHTYAAIDPNNKAYNLPVYQYIRANGGWSNWTMEIIETAEFEDKTAMRNRERHFVEELGGELNAVAVILTPEERQANQRDISRRRYEENREEILRNAKEKNRQMRIEQKLKHYEELENDGPVLQPLEIEMRW